MRCFNGSRTYTSALCVMFVLGISLSAEAFGQVCDRIFMSDKIKGENAVILDLSTDTATPLKWDSKARSYTPLLLNAFQIANLTNQPMSEVAGAANQFAHVVFNCVMNTRKRSLHWPPDGKVPLPESSCLCIRDFGNVDRVYARLKEHLKLVEVQVSELVDREIVALRRETIVTLGMHLSLINAQMADIEREIANDGDADAASNLKQAKEKMAALTKKLAELEASIKDL